MTLDAPGHSLPWLVAHRGAMAEAPENTEHAFDAALQHPIAGIEFDVQLSRDCVPVIFHDVTIGRTTGQKGAIGDYPYDVLKTFDCGRWFSERFAGTRILSLQEALRRYADRTALLIELKTGGGGDDRKRRQLVQRTIAVIYRTVYAKWRCGIYILSFDADALAIANQTAPNLKCILNLKRPGKTVADADDFIRGFGLPLRKLTRSFSDEAHSVGKQIMTYSCNTPDEVDKALQLDADLVLTDDPAQVAGYFSETIRRSGLNSQP